jgi:flagellar hook-length control protein FliK
MPYSTTTSITAGSVLDAIPASAGTPQDDQPQTSFDALLRPPAPSVCAPPPADDHSPDTLPRAEELEHDEESSPDQPQENSSSAPSSQSAAKSEDDQARKEKSPQDDEDVVAESAAAALASAAANSLPAAVDKSGAEAKALANNAAKGAELPAAQQAAFEGTPAQPAGLQAAAEQVAANPPPDVAAAQVTVGAGKIDKTGRTATANKSGSIAANGSGIPGERAVQPSIAQADSTALLASTDDKKSTGESSERSREKPEPHKEPDAIVAGVEVLTAATPASDAPSSGSDKTGSPPAAQPPGVAEGSPTLLPTSTAGVQPGAPPVISRLPGEALAEGSKTIARRPVSEAETARLLGRVARAFTAAQQGDGEIRLRLSPPELGALRLQIQVNDGALVARMETETSAARTALIDNLPVLRERLAEQGVRIERFDVDLMQRQPGGMPDQPGGRQQEPLADQFRLSPPARPRLQPAVATLPSSLAAGSADGLNVIV